MQLCLLAIGYSTNSQKKRVVIEHDKTTKIQNFHLGVRIQSLITSGKQKHKKFHSILEMEGKEGVVTTSESTRFPESPGPPG